jgi:hypothetical protein
MDDSLRWERAAIVVDRAARQYQACEPENRLVARELERRWEEALKQQRQLDEEYERFARSAPAELDEEAMSSIRALAADLPAVWSAASTTPADRRLVARLLLERVVVTVQKEGERVEVELHGSAARCNRTPSGGPSPATISNRTIHDWWHAYANAPTGRTTRRRSPSGSTPKGSARRNE